MGSEQSAQSQNGNSGAGNISHHSTTSAGAPKLQRGHTIAAPGSSSDHHHNDTSPSFSSSSRPVSPPISVCSDSDLPYISYTDRPIGDSPKIRNKLPAPNRNTRTAPNPPKRQSSTQTASKSKSSAHNVIVVNPALKDGGLQLNEEMIKLKTIPMFLPVMRGTLSLPANRDPEVLERLQPGHLKNMCSTVQTYYNSNAKCIAADQAQLTAKIKEIDGEIVKLVGLYTEKQKLYSTYAEHFSKVRNISQQLIRCNTLLNQNIDSMEQLNSLLDISERLEPFVWKTS